MKMERLTKKNSQLGFALLEAMISVVVASVVLGAFITLNLQSTRTGRANVSEVRATLYLRELIEVAKDLEISNFDELKIADCAAPNHCHPVLPPVGAWDLAAGDQTLEGTFTRWLSVEDVCRDGDDQIVPCGGPFPPDGVTKKVTANITWDNGFTSRSKSLEAYVYEF